MVLASIRTFRYEKEASMGRACTFIANYCCFVFGCPPSHKHSEIFNCPLVALFTETFYLVVPFALPSVAALSPGDTTSTTPQRRNESFERNVASPPPPHRLLARGGYVAPAEWISRTRFYRYNCISLKAGPKFLRFIYRRKKSTPPEIHSAGNPLRRKPIPGVRYKKSLHMFGAEAHFQYH